MRIAIDAAGCALCREKAERVVASYKAGRKPRSEAFDRKAEKDHGSSIRFDVDKQMIGCLGEYGVAVALGLNPVEVLDWSDKPDIGHDLIWSGKKIDVKSSDVRNPHYLMWSEPKTELLWSLATDIFILAAVEKLVQTAEVRPLCWVSVSEFRQRHQTAKRHDGSNLWPGTRYMHRKDCHPFQELLNGARLI